jgi:TRAP-type C4-dicarboxylate transport system substrate-binding protein
MRFGLSCRTISGGAQRSIHGLDDDLGNRLTNDISRATHFRVLAFWDHGFRHFSN